MISLKVFAQGEIILEEGELDEKAYVIEKGRVEVFLRRNDQEISLHILGPGEPVGEMSIIDDKPHSATVRALDPEVTLKEIHRDDFTKILKEVPEQVTLILKGIFERLRHANYLIARYEEERKLVAVQDKTPPTKGELNSQKEYLLEISGTTPQAQEALQGKNQKLGQFPFRIGRISSDPMANCHLSLPDNPPYRVSRHHAAIIRDEGRLAVLDSGSHLGTIVNGISLGGDSQSVGPEFLQVGENSLILGKEDSPFQFKLTLSQR